MSAVLAMMARDTALDDVRYYLRAWRRWVRDWRAPLGAPSAVTWVDQCLPTVCGDADTDDQQIDVHILRSVNAEVESLPTDMRTAVRLVYLNEIGPSVFRSGRMTMETARRLCARAEEDMVPRLRARGVVLGGI